jgi:3,4-dihydroxy 2-butanone 4-phosphate synthase/GTP cyclohydrolase II
LVRRAVECDFPTTYGQFRAVLYENTINGEVHVALTMGDVGGDEPVLVRVHTENITFAMFGSLVGDAGPQLRASLEKIAAAGRGAVLYLRQREHNLDLVHQLKTYALMQEQGLTLAAASQETGYGVRRDYGVGAQILHDLGLRRIVLLSNKPPRVTALEGFGLEYAGHIPLDSPATES